MSEDFIMLEWFSSYINLSIVVDESKCLFNMLFFCLLGFNSDELFFRVNEICWLMWNSGFVDIDEC